jgi:two-component system, LytTR family, response regulator LytT
MKLLIVEDEQLLARHLINLVTNLEPAAIIAGQTNSIENTVNWLNTNQPPDLIFMDIELADGQCFEIFQQVAVKSPVIFTTAYNEYALKAFKVNSIDYLLKPIRLEDLRYSLNKWKELQESSAPMQINQLQRLVKELSELKQVKLFSDHPCYRERFLVKHGQKMIAINTIDVAFFQAKNTLNFINTKSKQKFLLDCPLDQVEKLVSPRNFFRANRQFILSNDIVTAVHPWFNGKLKIETSLITGDDIIVSREKAAQFKLWLGG